MRSDRDKRDALCILTALQAILTSSEEAPYYGRPADPYYFVARFRYGLDGRSCTARRE